MIRKLLSSVLLTYIFYSSVLFAQCDGQRFTDIVFPEVQITQDVNYGSSTTMSGDTKILRFDFYEPKNDVATQRPLIILAHGGSFIGGNENSADIVTLAQELAKRGYVVASINYRLIDQVVLPNQTIMMDAVVKAVQDMKAAIRFFRQDAATTNTYRINPDMIIAGGASAGAVTAIHTAYLDTEEGVPSNIITIINDNGGIEGNSGNAGYSSSVNAVINLCGAIGDTNWIQAGEEPIVSAHGTNDATLPYGAGNAVVMGFTIMPVFGSQSIDARCQELGIPTELLTFQGGDHMVHATTANYPTTIATIVDFIAPIVCSEATTVHHTAPVATYSITPNPAQDIVRFDLPNTAQFSIIITDQTAKIWQTSYNEHTLSLGKLPRGIYFAQIKTDVGISIQKIVLQ